MFLAGKRVAKKPKKVRRSRPDQKTPPPTNKIKESVNYLKGEAPFFFPFQPLFPPSGVSA